MRIRRRNKACFNCGHTLGEVYNYCPNCGQENNDNNMSFWILVKDFLHNYFSLDSRFRNTLTPFLIRPGQITKEYNAGRRVSFANPARLYLIMSILYFFMLSIINNYVTSEAEENISAITRGSSSESVESLDGAIKVDPDTTGLFNRLDWDLMESVQWDKSYSDRRLLDSMNLELGFFEKRVALQTIKMYRTNTITFKNHLLGNSPIMMIFIVPIYGLILKWTFRKTGKRYIHHLVHSLHLHSFAYLVYSLALILLIIVDNDFFSGVVIPVAFLGVTIYFLKSMKVMYEKSWIRTFFKFLFSGFVYQFLLLISMALLFSISFFLF